MGAYVKQHGDDLAGDFKNAMRRIASSVGIIATQVDGIKYGMAATSITAVSVEPPTLLFCVNKTASLHAPLMAAGCFSINILTEEQHQMCTDFGGRLNQIERFQRGDWRVDANDIPYFPAAQSIFLCQVERVVDFASHSVVFGRCLDVKFLSDIFPLLYADGRCRMLGAHSA